MTTGASLLLLLSMGFFGSIHCLGMCGGLVSALSLSRPRTWWRGLIAYQFGRVMTYVLLGLLVGMAGAGLSGFGGHVVQQGLAWFAGMAMAVFGLNLAGVLPDILARPTARVSQKLGLSRLAYHLAQQARLSGWFSMGLANGLLPCGLVYAALALAMKSGDITMSALMMVCFGLGTVPAMVLAPAALQRIAPALRGWLLRAAGILLLLIGLLTIWRGSGMPLHHMG